MERMTCTKVKELINAAIDGENSRIEQFAMQAHIKCCPSCRQHLGDQYMLSAMVRQSYAAPVETDLSRKIMAKLPPRKVVAKPKKRGTFAAAAVAASLLLAAAGAAVLAHKSHQDALMAQHSPYDHLVLQHLEKASGSEYPSYAVQTASYSK